MKKIATGVIGGGAIAQNCHIPGYAASPDCELTALADPDARCREMVRAGGWHFKNEYSDHKAMLAAEKLDVVSICTPNKFHAQIAVDCLDAGCDILLEKPIALTLNEAEQIRAAQLRSGKRVMVAFSHRFNELNHAARAAVSEGQIGRPYMYRIRMAHSGPWPGWAKTDWFYNRELAGGGALMDMAVHAFDLIRWYQGGVTSVSARVATLRKDIEVDDNVVAWMTFEDQCLGYIECGWTSASGFLGVEIMGDEGSIVVDYGKARTVMTRGTSTASGKNEMVETLLAEGYTMQAWPTQMATFTDGLRSGEPFSPSLQDGIDTLKLVLAAYESSRSGRRIDL